MELCPALLTLEALDKNEFVSQEGEFYNEKMRALVAKMKERSLRLGIVASMILPLTTGYAVAEQLSFQPRVSLGYQSYTFDLPDTDLLKVETDYLLGGLGLSVQGGRFFVDLYGQTNLTKAEDTEANTGGINNVDLQSEVDRYELNLTLGYAATQQISLFVGLKYANNKVKSDFVSDDAALDATLGNSFFDVEVEYLGPFVGASLAIPVADAGAFALSGSTAYLFGETKVDSEVLGGATVDLTIDGEALGFNLGAAWIGSLASLMPSLPGLGYTVGVDYSTYQFENDGGTEQFSEDTLRGKIDLKYSF